MKQCHEWTINFGMKKWFIFKIRMKQEWWMLKHNKKFRMILFGNWNKTQTNSFLEMGMSSSNVPNVFKGSSLTGHHVLRYWESRADIYYILEYFLNHCAYSKILNANNEFCCHCGNIYLSEVSILSCLAPPPPIMPTPCH